MDLFFYIIDILGWFIQIKCSNDRDPNWQLIVAYFTVTYFYSFIVLLHQDSQ